MLFNISCYILFVNNSITVLVSSLIGLNVPILLTKSLHKIKEISYCHSATYWYVNTEAR